MKRAYLKAYTLIELLVTMIITGVIFLCVMDGFWLFSRYATIRNRDIYKDMDMYNNNYRLDLLVESCDTLFCQTDSALAIMQGGQCYTLALHSDSSVTLDVNEIFDTLFTKAVSLCIVKKAVNYPVDTLIVAFKNKQKDNKIEVRYIKNYIINKRNSYD